MGKLILVLVILALVVMLYFRSNENKAVVIKNKKEGDSFLANNKNEEGVTETSSGLQYKVLTAGESENKPSASDRVKVHYHGTLLDGTVFDSSVDRNEPISFGLNQVIKGWTEGLQLMSVGDKYRLFIPSSLGYGNRAAGKITPGSVLIFDVELLGINE
jgi:peptidylprolyl isomerase